jgi:hypothetical protein
MANPPTLQFQTFADAERARKDSAAGHAKARIEAGHDPFFGVTLFPRIAAQHGQAGYRRIITREQGCALETLGHAVDYLRDSYINDGPDDEILDSSSPSMEAVRILVERRRELLFSLPLVEPLRRRIARRLFHRQRAESLSVLPFSSSGR